MAVAQLIDYLKDQSHTLEVTEITTTEIRSFIGHILSTRSDATAQQRYRSVNVLFRWLLAEGELEADPMERILKPKVEYR